MNFITHARLFDQPDPRRLDLRASISNVNRDWLVRVNQQRAAINVAVVADVSPSMRFHGHHNKVTVISDFIESLGFSTAAMGDSLSMQAFDHSYREDLAITGRLGRGAGLHMAQLIRDSHHANTTSTKAEDNIDEGLSNCFSVLADRTAIAFLVSDFHWNLQGLPKLIDSLGSTLLVPLVIWDRTETEPPSRQRLLSVSTKRHRSTNHHLWLKPQITQQWRNNVAQRKEALISVFNKRYIKPFMMTDGFDAEALTQYFIGMSAQ